MAIAITQRYENECEDLKNLALQQLNLPKNVKKGRFEGVDFSEIFRLLHLEIEELKEELLEYGQDEFSRTKSRKYINSKNARSEIGDCAGILVGLIAKIDSLKVSRSDFDTIVENLSVNY